MVQGSGWSDVPDALVHAWIWVGCADAFTTYRPIEDSMLLFEYGSPKEARFVPGRLHMGYPEANGFVYPWMEQVMAAAL